MICEFELLWWRLERTVTEKNCSKGRRNQWNPDIDGLCTASLPKPIFTVVEKCWEKPRQKESDTKEKEYFSSHPEEIKVYPPEVMTLGWVFTGYRWGRITPVYDPNEYRTREMKKLLWVYDFGATSWAYAAEAPWHLWGNKWERPQ